MNTHFRDDPLFVLFYSTDVIFTLASRFFVFTSGRIIRSLIAYEIYSDNKWKEKRRQRNAKQLLWNFIRKKKQKIIHKRDFGRAIALSFFMMIQIKISPKQIMLSAASFWTILIKISLNTVY